MWCYAHGYSSELYHHGILGQKWGIRRYQNADGSLTEAGKKHYARQEASDAKYRQREIDRNESNRQQSQYRSDKRIVKYGDKTTKYANKAAILNYADTRKSEKLLNKANKFKGAVIDEILKAEFNNVVRDIEKETIQNLTHDEIKKEKIAVGSAWVASLAATGTTVALAAAGVSPMYLILTPNDTQIKSNRRLSGKDDEYDRRITERTNELNPFNYYNESKTRLEERKKRNK